MVSTRTPGVFIGFAAIATNEMFPSEINRVVEKDGKVVGVVSLSDVMAVVGEGL